MRANSYTLQRVNITYYSILSNTLYETSTLTKTRDVSNIYMIYDIGLRILYMISVFEYYHINYTAHSCKPIHKEEHITSTEFTHVCSSGRASQGQIVKACAELLHHPSSVS